MTPLHYDSFDNFLCQVAGAFQVFQCAGVQCCIQCWECWLLFERRITSVSLPLIAMDLNLNLFHNGSGLTLGFAFLLRCYTLSWSLQSITQAGLWESTCRLLSSSAYEYTARSNRGFSRKVVIAFQEKWWDPRRWPPTDKLWYPASYAVKCGMVEIVVRTFQRMCDQSQQLALLIATTA